VFHNSVTKVWSVEVTQPVAGLIQGGVDKQYAPECLKYAHLNPFLSL